VSSTAPTLRPGDQLASTVSTTRVVVVRVPGESKPEITCGGSPMVPAGADRPASADAEPVTLIGKRYVDANDSLELLCTFSGQGELWCDGVPMAQKAAKALPASD
jgi:hypothetical protein